MGRDTNQIMLRAFSMAAVGATLLFTAACGSATIGGGANGGHPKANPSSSASQSQGCVAPALGQPNGKQWKTEPAMSIDRKLTYKATLKTNCGTITVALDAADAPRTVNSFIFLAASKYFDHTTCHRLTKEGIYVLQCGDPTGTGTGGPGYKFPDENLDGATYPAGTVAMANAGPGTNGSQFFLVYRAAPLPPSYTPFGRITSGMEYLRAIARQGVEGGGSDGPPAQTVSLDEVTAARG